MMDERILKDCNFYFQNYKTSAQVELVDFPPYHPPPKNFFPKALENIRGLP